MVAIADRLVQLNKFVGMLDYAVGNRLDQVSLQVGVDEHGCA
jgi:hypothetical protein